MTNECRHIMPSGLHCRAIAMRGSAFCYHHARPKCSSRPHEVRIAMPETLDSENIPAVLHQIINAICDGTISNRRAGVLLYSIQMSMGQTPKLPGPQIFTKESALEEIRKFAASLSQPASN
jgi:hypothetical protein